MILATPASSPRLVVTHSSNPGTVCRPQALPSLRVGEDAFFAVPTSWPVGLTVAVPWAAVVWLAVAVTLARRDVQREVALPGRG